MRDDEKEHYWSGLWANRITSNFLPGALQNDALNFGLEEFDASTIRYLKDENGRLRLARGDNDSR
jgi:hypothetical protein